MNDILLTGSCGYVGSALSNALYDRNVIGIDRFDSGNYSKNINKFLKADLNCLTQKLKFFLHQFSGVVIHLAAARTDDADSATYLADNIDATKALIETLDASKIKKFIHMGSVAAIDGEKLDQKSSLPNNPDDWYRLSKYLQQNIIEQWATENSVPLVILAPSAVYDECAAQNSTNIGRLEQIVRFVKIVPSVNVLKSLTAMSLLIKAIMTVANTNEENKPLKNNGTINRYLIIDQPIMTVSEICRRKFNAKIVIYIPKLKFFLLILASILRRLKLENRFPLTQDRVNKLFRPTAYCAGNGYSEWKNEELKPY